MGSAQKAILVPARPEALPIDPARTAVVVVDMQNDFGSEGGMFALAGIDISGIKSVVPIVAKVLAAARQVGILVIYLKMAMRPDLSDVGLPDLAHFQRHKRMHVGEVTKAPDGTTSRILIRDTWNTDIIAELAAEPSDLVVYKHRYSGFFETNLDEILKSRSIRTLIFTGCTTSVCVELTLRDAMFRDYACLLARGLRLRGDWKEPEPQQPRASLLVLEVLFGWITRSAEFIRGRRWSAHLLRCVKNSG